MATGDHVDVNIMHDVMEQHVEHKHQDVKIHISICTKQRFHLTGGKAETFALSSWLVMFTESCQLWLIHSIQSVSIHLCEMDRVCGRRSKLRPPSTI